MCRSLGTFNSVFHVVRDCLSCSCIGVILCLHNLCFIYTFFHFFIQAAWYSYLILIDSVVLISHKRKMLLVNQTVSLKREFFLKSLSLNTPLLYIRMYSDMHFGLFCFVILQVCVWFVFPAFTPHLQIVAYTIYELMILLNSSSYIYITGLISFCSYIKIQNTILKVYFFIHEKQHTKHET